MICVLMAAVLSSCKKSNFLDAKPSSSIVEPQSITDFQELLDNTTVLTYNGGLPQLSCDDYETTYANWQTVSNTERNAYTWAKDIYAGGGNIADWDALYSEVLYCNIVLDRLNQTGLVNTTQGQYLKGWALFDRSFAFYDLARNFCNTYDKSTANTDLGIPLRLSSGINYIDQRSTLQATYNQLLGDLATSINLLPADRPSQNLNRPCKIAAYALLARIYLDMRQYSDAENNADQSLQLYNTLIDYNTVSKTSTTPFSKTNNELILTKAEIGSYALTINSTTSQATIPDSIINLYRPNDLRLAVYFSNTAGTYRKKRGYFGVGLYPFMGLATDEMYLIKAECLARAGATAQAMSLLNQLLVNRYVSGTFTPVTASSSAQALSIILTERRKELIWRGLRWQDLKRLNKEGANITLTRTLNGVTYTLPPNDPRYVMPIPDDEIALSGIQQNNR